MIIDCIVCVNSFQCACKCSSVTQCVDKCMHTTHLRLLWYKWHFQTDRMTHTMTTMHLDFPMLLTYKYSLMSFFSSLAPIVCLFFACATKKAVFCQLNILTCELFFERLFFFFSNRLLLYSICLQYILILQKLLIATNKVTG